MHKPRLISLVLAGAFSSLGVAHATITPQSPSSWPANGISNYSDTALPLRGFNLSGAEFQPGVKGYDMNNFPSIEDTIYFAYEGENVVRVPFAWEFLQPGLPTSTAPIDWTTKGGYGQSYLQLISNLTNQGLTVIVDMHDYMRYETNLSQYANNSNTTDEAIIDTAGEPSSAQYAAAWASIAAAVDQNLTPAQSKLVIFELMNEPHNMNKPLISTGDEGPQAVLDLENAAITSIRAQEKADNAAAHTIMLDADWYTGMHSWAEPVPDYTNAPSNATVFTASNIKDPAKNYVLDLHQYLDSDFSGTHNDCQSNQDIQSIINQLVAPPPQGQDFLDWLSNNKMKVFLGEFGAGNGVNCEADMSTILSFVNQHAYNGTYGFVGFSAWSTGHAWGGYLLNISPGGPANIWMQKSDVLPAFLKVASSLPPLGQVVASLTNDTAYPLAFASSTGAFQTSTPGGLAPGATAYVYTMPNGTEPTQAQITYKTTLPASADQSQVVYYGFGMTADSAGDYRFEYPNTGAPNYIPVPFVQNIDAAGNKSCAIFTGGAGNSGQYILQTASCP